MRLRTCTNDTGGPSHIDVRAQAEVAVAIAERFIDAPVRYDLKTVEELFAPDVLILKSDGAELSREEYLGHPAISNKYLTSAKSLQLKIVNRDDSTESSEQH